MTDQITAYRRRVVSTYGGEFTLHTDVAGVFEDALLHRRRHPTLVHLALDMLMVQSMKSHATVSLLAQHGLMEDTATIARRLLELSVQAVYIGAESVEAERQRRAGRYLAFLWRQLPRRIKVLLPPKVRLQWTRIARRYGRLLPPKAKRWGPDLRTMFREAGADDLYVRDYSLLSSIAHGAADNQVFQFSASRIRVHDHRFAPILLVYSSRYYMVTAEQWNRAFALVDQAEFQRLTARVTEWRHRRGTEA